MAKDKKLFTLVDAGLLVGAVFFSISGFVYAALSGVVAIPGVQPFLQADEPVAAAVPRTTLRVAPKVVRSVLISQTPALESPMPTPIASAASKALAPASSAVSPVASPIASPVASPVASAQPAVSPVASPSPASSPIPKSLDEMYKKEAATIQAALTQYYKKHKKYPLSSTFNEGRTDKETTALKVLVAEGFIASLPKPADAPTYWYGYLSDGKTYDLTVRLRDISDPGGKYDQLGNYLYTIRPLE